VTIAMDRSNVFKPSGKTWEERAQFFINYFRNTDERYPEDKWKRGLEAAEAWLKLIKTQASTDEVARLLQTMRENRFNGSGWHDLSLQYYSWAKVGNFEVPSFEEYLSSSKE